MAFQANRSSAYTGSTRTGWIAVSAAHTTGLGSAVPNRSVDLAGALPRRTGNVTTPSAANRSSSPTQAATFSCPLGAFHGQVLAQRLRHFTRQRAEPPHRPPDQAVTIWLPTHRAGSASTMAVCHLRPMAYRLRPARRSASSPATCATTFPCPSPPSPLSQALQHSCFGAGHLADQFRVLDDSRPATTVSLTEPTSPETAALPLSDRRLIRQTAFHERLLATSSLAQGATR